MATVPANDTNSTGRYITGIESGFINVLIDRDQVDFSFGGDMMVKILNPF